MKQRQRRAAPVQRVFAFRPGPARLSYQLDQTASLVVQIVGVIANAPRVIVLL
jgi:hypothetical protein